MVLKESLMQLDKKGLADNVLNWVNSNSSLKSGNEIWQVGLVSSENLFLLQKKVLEDLSCVNWKFWNCEEFEKGFNLVMSLQKNPKIFKSEWNSYLEKGRYLFIYKTPLSSHEYYNQTRHYYGQMGS